MRTFDMITGKCTDDRPQVTFYDLTEVDDTSERLGELEEQVIILCLR